jgi:hypothetical protein
VTFALLTLSKRLEMNRSAALRLFATTLAILGLSGPGLGATNEMVSIRDCAASSCADCGAGSNGPMTSRQVPHAVRQAAQLATGASITLIGPYGSLLPDLPSSGPIVCTGWPIRGSAASHGRCLGDAAKASSNAGEHVIFIWPEV